jgi:tripartite-type tricarboxylate transporter receptor subunit TctC
MNAWWSMLLAVLAVVAASPASGADVPGQPVRIVVPFPPGGGTDVVARLIAERLTPILGTQVLADNRPGGNSVIATRHVAAAPADGHTLLLTTDIHAINAAYGLALPYDSLASAPQSLRSCPRGPQPALGRPGGGLDDFAFVAQWTTSPLMLAAHPAVNARSLPELVALARARPGKLVALAVTSPARTPAAPDVPTVAESGYPEFALVNWYAILAPAGTPPAVVARLNREIGAVMHEPLVVERVVAAGLDVATGGPADLEALVRRDIDRYPRIIALTGARPEER